MTRYWSCRKCHHRNERTSSRRCAGCGEQTKRKARVPKHAVTLRDDPYAVFRDVNEQVHGPAMPAEWQPDDCGCCGVHPKGTRHMDRDHGHDRTESSYGKPRGLACPGDWGCNKLMSRISLEHARLIVAYLERVEAHYAERAV